MSDVLFKIYRVSKEDGSRVPMPKYETPGSNAFDLYSANTEDIVIKANENVMVPLGIKVDIPSGYQLLLFNRSGMATKSDCVLTTGVSIIDSDYRGEIIAPIKNHGKRSTVLEPFTRICQGQIVPAPQVTLTEVEEESELSDTERGDGGFGSTGEK